jgi:hypothetical protein
MGIWTELLIAKKTHISSVNQGKPLKSPTLLLEMPLSATRHATLAAKGSIRNRHQVERN